MIVMLKLLSSRDIADSMRCAMSTARLLMREMKPINIAPMGSKVKELSVTEEKIMEWVKVRQPAKGKRIC